MTYLYFFFLVSLSQTQICYQIFLAFELNHFCDLVTSFRNFTLYQHSSEWKAYVSIGLWLYHPISWQNTSLHCQCLVFDDFAKNVFRSTSTPDLYLCLFSSNKISYADAKTVFACNMIFVLSLYNKRSIKAKELTTPNSNQWVKNNLGIKTFFNHKISS